MHKSIRLNEKNVSYHPDHQLLLPGNQNDLQSGDEKRMKWDVCAVDLPIMTQVNFSFLFFLVVSEGGGGTETFSVCASFYHFKLQLCVTFTPQQTLLLPAHEV